ncbi:3-deoxy-D-manno-octulosonic acid transferase [Adhaeribacter rhizoryzae]|uniref:3-deoxy-D-manno-octulosonic acid transferase n=1 Tax=Adhaeribacter rhizoryzae TaxID=2607907 RepID=A0A5M6D0Y4_9BACT|nr:glycosyltransferase N-terminal domain-containing protein [Adhaeribacter rhizoryzae]KAA5539269.1 3-deoxy-D-manno-octulosonic acid transferase [Adhaeribacter rhizoryzae]
MSRLLYSLGTKAYGLLLQVSAPFHAKAAQWVAGRKDIFEQIPNKLAGNTQPVAWFHCASLGEFEQGRPLIEKFSSEYPQYKILLTFFSPSGYEVRKNYAGAHYIFYLPQDSAANARRFVDLVQPKLAVFVKYEFWYYYLAELHRRQIPAISVSAIFRPSQLFFKPYGGFYRGILKLFTHIFTQNQASAALLQNIGLNQITVAGDTRFDRVLQTVASVKIIPLVEQFKAGKPIFVVGSSWPQDMEILLPFIKQHTNEVKFIIAPHEIHVDELNKIVADLPGQAIRFSQAQEATVANYQVLLIDNIGMLSSLYSYGTYAYIGGAFGKGLHNTLEAAVFGLPLFFGPTYLKFQEAIDLVELGVANPIQNTAELTAIFTRIATNVAEREAITRKAKNYVHEQAGATDIILGQVHQWLQKV